MIERRLYGRRGIVIETDDEVVFAKASISAEMGESESDAAKEAREISELYDELTKLLWREENGGND